jgi:hypothetical protein
MESINLTRRSSAVSEVPKNIPHKALIAAILSRISEKQKIEQTHTRFIPDFFD